MYNLERYTLVSDLFKFNYSNVKFVPMVTEKFAPLQLLAAERLLYCFIAYTIITNYQLHVSLCT